MCMCALLLLFLLVRATPWTIIRVRPSKEGGLWVLSQLEFFIVTIFIKFAVKVPHWAFFKFIFFVGDFWHQDLCRGCVITFVLLQKKDPEMRIKWELISRRTAILIDTSRFCSKSVTPIYLFFRFLLCYYIVPQFSVENLISSSWHNAKRKFDESADFF